VNHLIENSRAVLFPALILTHVILLVVLISLRTAPFIGSETDGVYYMISARALFTQAFIPATFGGGIGMPLAIAAVNLIISDTFRSAQFVSAVAGLVYLIAAVRIFTKIVSPAVGMITGALLLASPILLLNSTSSLTDVLGASLPAMAIWILLRDNSSNRWSLVLAGGFLLGVAYAVRSINLVFFPIVLVAALGNDRRRNVKNILLSVGGLLLGSLPQLYINQKYFGNPLYSDNWRNTAAMVFDWDYVNTLSSFREVLQQAGPALFALWIKRFLIDVPVALYHVAYFPLLFAVPGVFLLLKKAQNTHRRLMMTWIASTTCYLFLVAGVWRIESRYFLPVLPLVFAAGVVMWQELTGRWKAVSIAGFVLAMVMSGFVTVRDARVFLKSQSTEFKEAGLFLQGTAARDDVILASQPSVFFYAQRPGVLIESIQKDFDSTLASRRIDWVVFDERRGYRDNPNLGWMLDPASQLGADRGWQPVFVRDSPRIVVWRTTRVSVRSRL
jgi:hypothetical protein